MATLLNKAIGETPSLEEVVALVEMPRLLEALGFSTTRRAGRCACLIHGGKNPTTFSWSEDGLWFCFRCAIGGDRIALVMAVKKCSFREALEFLASLVGVRFSFRRRSRAELRRLAEKRQRIGDAAWQLRDEVVSLRGRFRDRLLRAERLQWITGEHLRKAKTTEETDHSWSTLARLAPVVTFFLASFTFLNNAEPTILIKFARASGPARRQMILEGVD